MFNGLSFLGKDENDFDGFLTGVASNEKSNLADIFDADTMEKSSDVRPSLKYIPPKAKPPQENAEKSTYNVVIAKIVSAYKLIDEKNSSVGQLGLAILNNSVEDATKMILYKTKDQIMATLQLTKTSKVYWKPPYLQFHDDFNGFWSLLFSDDAETNEFFAKLQEVCSIERCDTPKSIINDTTEKEKQQLSPEISAKSAEPKEIANVDEIDATNPSPTKTKSDVVYRVAKIGHQLPKFKSVTDNEIDDSMTLTDVEKILGSPSFKSAYDNSGEISTFEPRHLPPKPRNISVALQPPYWPSSSTFDLNTFASENRIQNTELRMNFSKLDSKVDRILDNIDRLRLSSSNNETVNDKEEEIIKLEEKVLDLKKENRLLKLQLVESEHTKMASSDKEKDSLTALRKSNTQKEIEINELTTKLKEAEEKLKLSTESMEAEKEQLKEKYTTDLNNLREELEQKNKESNKGSNTNHSETIRNIMNQFYVKLYQSIDGKDSMTSADILKLTAEIIRKETKAALNSN